MCLAREFSSYVRCLSTITTRRNILPGILYISANIILLSCRFNLQVFQVNIIFKNSPIRYARCGDTPTLTVIYTWVMHFFFFLFKFQIMLRHYNYTRSISCPYIKKKKTWLPLYLRISWQFKCCVRFVFFRTREYQFRIIEKVWRDIIWKVLFWV